MQHSLFATRSEDDKIGFTERFRRLYYHLYSNSNASRAEKITSELSKILLIKLGAEKLGEDKYLKDEVDKIDFNPNILINFINRAFPRLSWNSDEFSLDTKSVKTAFQEIYDIRLHDAPAHVFGDAFQALIGPKIRGDKGQFFTPPAIVDAMIEILDPKHSDIVMDPACGTGGFLSAAYRHANAESGNKKGAIKLLGIDKDNDLAFLASSLLEVSTNGCAEVINANSLNFFDWNEDNSLTVDVIATNPPFGSNIKITDKEILSRYDLGKVWTKNQNGDWKNTGEDISAQDPQILFIELCIRTLKPGGRMGMVLPEGVFGNKTSMHVWEYMNASGQIYAMIDCPRTSFQPYTDTKTNIIFFRKYEIGECRKKYSTKIAVAIKCGHDKRGKAFDSLGKPVNDDFREISRQFSLGMSDFWVDTQLESDYFVPRYYTNDRGLGRMGELGEVTSLGKLMKDGFLTIKSGHEVGSEAYGTGDIPFVRTSDIINLEISSDPTNSVSEEIYKKYSKRQNLRVGNILLSADGRYKIGKTAIVHANNVKSVIQSHIKILSLREDSPISSYELLYILNMPEVQNQIRNIVFVQSTLGTIGDRVVEVKIPIPNATDSWMRFIDNFKNMLQTRADILSNLKNIVHEAEL